MVVEARAKARVYSQRPGQVWGTVGDRDKRPEVWNGDTWVDRACSAVAPCAARCMSAPRRSTYPAADNTGRLTAERLRAVPRAHGRAPEWVVDTAPPPAHVAELAVATVCPAAVSVQLQQVPRGQGSRATQERRKRRIHGGNR